MLLQHIIDMYCRDLSTHEACKSIVKYSQDIIDLIPKKMVTKYC